MNTLSGKTALVTGGSRGIGRASALALARAEAQVMVHYGRGAKDAEAVVSEIRTAGGRADAVSADLAPPDGPMKLADQRPPRHPRRECRHLEECDHRGDHGRALRPSLCGQRQGTLFSRSDRATTLDARLSPKTGDGALICCDERFGAPSL
jgi:hypothetical protein